MVNRENSRGPAVLRDSVEEEEVTPSTQSAVRRSRSGIQLHRALLNRGPGTHSEEVVPGFQSEEGNGVQGLRRRR